MTFAKKKDLIDDPGGFKARLENLYSRNHYILPLDISAIMLRRTGRVYDIELDLSDQTGWFIRITSQHSKSDSLDKIKRICSSLNKWGCSDALRNALEELDGPLLESINVDLGMGKRWLTEFD